MKYRLDYTDFSKIELPPWILSMFDQTHNEFSFIVWLSNNRNGFTDSLESFVTEGAD